MASKSPGPAAAPAGGDGFPVARYLCIMAVMMTNCATITFLFPFVGFYVIHLGIAEDKAGVGYYAGIVCSMFFLGRAVSNFAWGLIADIYGRKPVLLFNLMSSAVTMCGFGFSGSLFELCVWRFVAGLLNGISSVARVASFEMASTKEHQNRGAAWLQIAWGAGLVMGPSVGGYLSEPCTTDSDLMGFFRPGGVFCTYPYSLPCIVGALLHVLVLPCWWYLPETALARRPLPCSGLIGRLSGCCGGRNYRSVPLPANEPLPPKQHKRDKVAFKDKDLESAKPALDAAYAEQLRDACCIDPGSPPACVGQPGKIVEELGVVEGRQLSLADGEVRKLPLPHPNPPMQTESLGLCNRRFLQLVCVQCVSVMSLVMCQDLASLWCILPVSRGGPQWSAESIGKAWVVFGVVLLLLQVRLVPGLIDAFGNEVALKAALCVNVVLQALLPWLALANPAGGAELEGTLRPAPLLFGLFLAVTAAQQFTNQVIVVPISTLVNSSVDVASRARGTGLAMALTSLFMAASPTVAGVVLAATVELAGERAADPLHAWPGGTHPAFLASSGLLVVAWLLVVFLPPEAEEEQKAVG